jgi:hypothetical protein
MLRRYNTKAISNMVSKLPQEDNLPVPRAQPPCMESLASEEAALRLEARAKEPTTHQIVRDDKRATTPCSHVRPFRLAIVIVAQI